jgi:hypothetical protein
MFSAHGSRICTSCGCEAAIPRMFAANDRHDRSVVPLEHFDVRVVAYTCSECDGSYELTCKEHHAEASLEDLYPDKKVANRMYLYTVLFQDADAAAIVRAQQRRIKNPYGPDFALRLATLEAKVQRLSHEVSDLRKSEEHESLLQQVSERNELYVERAACCFA